MTEKWEPIEGYEAYYEISDQGRVNTFERERKLCNLYGPYIAIYPGHLMTPKLDRYGYLRIGLTGEDGKKKYFMMHALVATAFIGRRPDDCNQINHKDCDKTHNVPANLEWCDGKHNQRHSYQNGTHALNLHRCPDTGQVIPKRMYAT
jgi:hypothetical protein